MSKFPYLAIIRDRVIAAVKSLVTSGLTSKDLALTVTLGVSLGVLPVLWGTTLVCMSVAFLFRLNPACIQIVNFLSYPLQIALLVPFYRLGERMFPPPTATSNIDSSVVSTLFHGVEATGKAIAAWCCIVPATALFLYLILYAILSKRRGVASRERAALDIQAS